MNNLTWSGKSPEDKKSQAKKEDIKKKKISYTKETEDLEKIYTKIKEKYEGRQPRECFCASVRRRIWSKDFETWYEKSLRQVH